MLESRAIWSAAPPDPRSRSANWPTVLFSWWCTSVAAVIILTRLCGRMIRSDKLFREDWIMMLSLIPLFIRMIFTHFVLIYGTNNVNTIDNSFTPLELYHHEIGARLVLAARIFYAMFIWLNKLSISEFLKRITVRVWRRSWETTLQGIRIFLFVTFGGVVIATLAECQPFNHYWQVIPDPGPHCRQGFAQLLVMGTCDIVTDILLIAFPIPVVLSSGQTWKRKLEMTLLFSLSFCMIAVTATRMPQVILHHGRQQYRTVWASGEILASAAVSNAVILGSFLRDKGTKKNKYRTFSITDSIDRVSSKPTVATRDSADSDEGLFRSLGLRIPEHLQDQANTVARLAPPALPASHLHRHKSTRVQSPPPGNRDGERDSDSEESLNKYDARLARALPSPSDTHNMNFFDVGNLLEGGSSSRSATMVDSGAPEVTAHDFANLSSVTSHHRSGSRTSLRDVGDRLSPSFTRRETRDRSPGYQTDADPIGVLGPMLERQETQVSLQDAGGLLWSGSSRPTRASNGELEAAGWRAFAARSPRPIPPMPADGQLHEEDIELDELGSSRAGRRPLPRTAVSLQEMLSHNRQTQTTTTLSSSQSSHQHGDFDDVILHDPGGLAKQ